MRRFTRILAPVILICFVLAGCGGVSEDRPIAEVKAEAAKMASKDLQAMVDKYKKAIESKNEALKKLKDKLSKVPVTEIMADEAKALKGDIDGVAKSIKALSDRLNVYVRELNVKI